jgi:methylated-DNA-[protein]-cysteine S-methyltransferase
MSENRAGGGREQTMTVAVHTVVATTLGELTVVREGASLTGLYFPRHWPRPDRATFGDRTDEGFEEAARQVAEFLAGDRTAFDLPLEPRGSDFDRRVWGLVAAVPYGETSTYGALARSMGAGTEARDVGAAVGRNPLCIIIPCHRVVGANGQLTGYAGGLSRKRALLELEHAGSLKAGRAPEGLLW